MEIDNNLCHLKRPLTANDVAHISNEQFYKSAFLFDKYQLVAFPEYPDTESHLGIILYDGGHRGELHLFDLQHLNYSRYLFEFMVCQPAGKNMFRMIDYFNVIQDIVSYYYEEVKNFTINEIVLEDATRSRTCVLFEESVKKLIVCTRFDDSYVATDFLEEISDVHRYWILESRRGFLTIIKNEKNWLYKICFSYEPDVRVLKLIRGGEPVSLTYAIKVSKWDIQSLQRFYSHKCRFGDWFELSETDINEIKKAGDDGSYKIGGKIWRIPSLDSELTPPPGHRSPYVTSHTLSLISGMEEWPFIV